MTWNTVKSVMFHYHKKVLLIKDAIIFIIHFLDYNYTNQFTQQSSIMTTTKYEISQNMKSGYETQSTFFIFG